MNSDWQTYLCNQHAVILNNCVLHFGDISAELSDTQNKTIMTDLSHRGLIQFSGDDAKNFLQSQLSCDIREISSEIAQYGGYCTSKGRILASFLLWQKNQSVIMQLPASLVASTIKRLSLYILRSKVQLTDISNAWIRIGVAGPNISVLTAEFCKSANNSDPVIDKEISMLHVANNRMEVITSIENAPAVWERLKQNASPVGAACWDWLDIQSGIPVILPETQEAFLPQMINLDAIGGVSFKKGCYPGQEIVARTQYLGKLKRRMFLVHLTTTETIKAGDALYSADMVDQSCGNIVNIAPSPCGGYDALAVIQQSSVNTCNIHWQSLQGPTLKIKSLPYTLPV
ncbi:hypothetical protein C8R27_11422 [Nitrosomonas ureae]|uniref:CAF17-like 4Fe-4S cluster assembly/insertion protein YgfZ n=1 Tax=Nitrosomonas ureae TaxID=44577 RepID=UPI000D76E3FD|nr:folate-binding protein YgfZ [Nitrosomonas ureae]PXX14668.1 hypothetical protein C8R27_11422 [Nitrosomonas ureae]